MILAGSDHFLAGKSTIPREPLRGEFGRSEGDLAPHDFVDPGRHCRSLASPLIS